MDATTIKLLERIRLPKNYYEVGFTGMDDSEHKTLLFNWYSNITDKIGTRGLIFYGKYGTGKSSCAAILLKAALIRGIIGLWLDYADLKGIKSYDTFFEVGVLLVDRAKEVPLLVIDELAIGSGTAGGRKSHDEVIFENIVRHRVNNRLTTIITTNHQPLSIKKMNPGIASILKEATETVQVIGKDYREEA